ncbi:MAG TPA: very short patch repair endonuclease [Acidimicrobiia bacterium]|nr:very short patch repair endonuclease [Acidimicrobiia bacterium]
MRGRTVALGGGKRVPYPVPKNTAATRVGKGNTRKDTTPEVRLRSALHGRGLRFRKDFVLVVEGRRVRPDIVFTRVGIAVFVDGCFWHCCPVHGTMPTSNPDYWVPKLRRNVERDRQIDVDLARDGWIVVRVWEHEDAEQAAACIAARVGDRRAPAG